MKKKFIENFLSLSLLRILTLIVPLITFPYLIKVLGSEKYGLVMWAWSIMNFFILFINFGFDLSVTKYISIYRNDNVKISEIVSNTFVTKMFLSLISFFILLILICVVPEMKEHKELFFCSFTLALGETMMPIWFFQGIEQMKYTAVITTSVKIMFTILVFYLINDQEDYLKVPLIYAISTFVSALFAYYLIFVKNKIKIVKPKINNIVFYIKDSFSLFLSNSISVLKENITIIFIEKYIGLTAVAYYDISQKFINILITPFHILASVLFPYLSKTKDFNLLKKIIIFNISVSFLIYILIYIFTGTLVKLLIGEINPIVEMILKILAFSIVFSNLTSVLGINGLVVLGKNKELFISSLSGLLFYICLLFIFLYLKMLTIELVAVCIIFGYIIDLIMRYYYLRKFL